MISGKKILILGLGKEGVSAANYLSEENDITFFDEKTQNDIDQEIINKLRTKKAKFIFQHIDPQNYEFDYLIRSPGFIIDSPIIKSFTIKGSTLTSSTKIFFDDCPAQIIGVTGTKGKGTTSSLIFEILKNAKKDVKLAGNIGLPALDVIPELMTETIVILELSSFQLVDLHKSPHIAVVLMITSEHLNWHNNKEEYQHAKESIVNKQSQNDYAIINADFTASKSFANKTKANVFFFSTRRKTDGTYLDNHNIMSQIYDKEIICTTSDVFLAGKHNLQNVLASVAVAKVLKIPNHNIRNTLKMFKGLRHRLELIDTVNGVKYYNDSFSTTPETTIAAIDSFTEPKILILGGSSKKSSFEKLAAKIISDSTVKGLVLIGEESQKFKDAISKAGKFYGEIYEGASSMASIVRQAKEAARAGDIVILSPACASFDMFKNYSDRGEMFTSEVKKMKNGK